jgi:hypothetical protein
MKKEKRKWYQERNLNIKKKKKVIKAVSSNLESVGNPYYCWVLIWRAK